MRHSLTVCLCLFAGPACEQRVVGLDGRPVDAGGATDSEPPTPTDAGTPGRDSGLRGDASAEDAARPPSPSSIYYLKTLSPPARFPEKTLGEFVAFDGERIALSGGDTPASVFRLHDGVVVPDGPQAERGEGGPITFDGEDLLQASSRELRILSRDSDGEWRTQWELDDPPIRWGGSRVSVAVSHPFAAHGLPNAPNSEGGYGLTRLYHLTTAPPTVTEVAAPEPGDLGSHSMFGADVALAGSNLAVAAWHSDIETQRGGAVYLYELNNGHWGLSHVVTAPSEGPELAFASSIALSENTLVIGAPLASDANTGVGTSTPAQSGALPDSGAVYVFTKSGGDWIFEAYLKPHNTGAGFHFGRSVALDRNVIVIGAPGESGRGTGIEPESLPDPEWDRSGAAYVFQRTPDGWRQVAYLKALLPQQGDEFGAAVAVRSGRVLVGVPFDDFIDRGVHVSPPGVRDESNPTRYSPDDFGGAYLFDIRDRL